MMSKYKISIDGCDDSTIFDIELTPTQAKLIEKISKLSYATSTYGCRPTLEVNQPPNPEKEWYMSLSKQEYRQLRLTTNSHTGGSLFVTSRAVRAVVTHAIVIVNKLWRCWKPVVFSTIVTYKPYLHHPTIVTQIYSNVKHKELTWLTQIPPIH